MSERIQIPSGVEIAAGVAGGLAVVSVMEGQPLGAAMLEGNQDGGYPGEHETTTTTTEVPTTTTTEGKAVVGPAQTAELYPNPPAPNVPTPTTPKTHVSVPVKKPESLPFTGGDILGLGAIGITTLAVGSLMARAKARGHRA